MIASRRCADLSQFPSFLVALAECNVLCVRCFPARNEDPQVRCHAVLSDARTLIVTVAAQSFL